MFDHNHYMPILKGRDGEYGALRRIDSASRDRLTPLVEIPPVPWDFANKVPGKSIDRHLEKVCLNIQKSWGADRELLLDTLWIPEKDRMKNGEHPLSHILKAGRRAGLKLIPMTGLVRGDDHLKACREGHKSDQFGVGLRIQREDFVDFDLSEELDSVLEKLNVQPQETDLLLDLRSVADTEAGMTPADVISLIRRIPKLRSWRTFTLAATAFPSTLMKLPPSDCSKISRLEWKLWKEVLETLPDGIRKPTFGDYAISHPEPSEVDPRIMRPSASVRYTSRTYWLVIKAKNLRDHGFKQFHSICKQLVQRTEYSGAEFSWGDDYIDDCGCQRVGPGNLTTWRKVGTSHHVAFVLQQIANLASV